MLEQDTHGSRALFEDSGRRHMRVESLVRFHDEHFFDGAVQLRWVQEREAQAQQAARAFVFHGPRYHGAGEADKEGIDANYRLKDSASFVADLLDSIQASLAGAERNPYLLAVAGYGAGKSHLATALAVLLDAPGAPAAADILAHLAKADATIGTSVEQGLARLGKPVLVLCLDGMAGFHLGNAVSRSLRNWNAMAWTRARFGRCRRASRPQSNLCNAILTFVPTPSRGSSPIWTPRQSARGCEIRTRPCIRRSMRSTRMRMARRFRSPGTNRLRM
ncbi:hypothetical protein [Thiocystis violacea]|uniref:hypothetical protein n=1 Tax=Thiocystis violacea TaxID=13725 RepID=UPI001A911F5F|nr:hypothetical protein [Thiocystis violacea]